MGYSDGSYGIVAYFLETPVFMPLYCHGGMYTKCGKVYREWYIDMPDGDETYPEVITERISTYVLLLPLFNLILID